MLSSKYGAENEIWATMVVKEEGEDEIRPRCATECGGVSVGAPGWRVLECRAQC